MSYNKHVISLFAAAAMLAALSVATSSVAAGNDRPAVIQSLEKQGVTNVQEFPAGNGLRGFAGVAEQQPVTAYVMPDGNAIIGVRVGPDGKSLDDQRLQDLVAKPMSAAIWSKLTATTWVQDGKDNAPRIVYVFSDPNCPYCNRFFDAARPWVDSGKVQLRHILVGVIKADSSTKAAAILGASDKTAALLKNEHDFTKGGIKPAANVPANIKRTLDTHAALMAELGLRGTPGIVYQDDQGLVQTVGGLPQSATLAKVMGPR